MKIAISGASGYIAGNLIIKLEAQGNEIVKIKREALYDADALKKILTGTDVVINLAGAPILQRWTDQKKKEILQSRMKTTLNIVQVINSISAESRPKTLLQASAVGIYAPGRLHDETSRNFATDFVGNVVQAWEKPTDELLRTVRLVVFRVGVVLGKSSQTIKSILPVFRKGLGGKIGSGMQSFPFVHIDDLIGAVYWAINNNEVHGVYNLVSPNQTNNLDFTAELSKQLRRPALFKVPVFALKLAYGEAASIILSTPFVQPARLIKYGYRFKFPDIKTAVQEIVGKS